MRKRVGFPAWMAFVFGVAASPPGSAADLVIANVRVVDVVAGQVSEPRDVEVTGDRITAIHEPAAGAHAAVTGRRFDAQGGYLVPGFWDMHAHLNYPSVVEKWSLPLFTAAGVTAVRDMQGDCWRPGCDSTVQFMRGLQRKIGKGELLGPRIVAIASDLVHGPKARADNPARFAPSTAQGGKWIAREIKRRGADFIKPYDTLPRDAYFGMMSEARRIGLPVGGHVPLSVTTLEAVNAGQRTIDHAKHPALDCARYSRTFTEVYSTWAAGKSSSIYRGWARAENGDREIGSLYPMILATYDEALCEKVIAGIAASGAWYVPTLITRKFEAYADDLAFLKDDRLRLVPADIRKGWEEDAGNYQRRFKDRREKQVYVDFYELDIRLVGKMHAAGVPVLVGTDASDSYCFPGSALHDEMGELKRAGMSDADILRAATIVAARFMGQADRFGTVEAGKAADLVVLARDPLQDIANVRGIQAVVRDGKLLDRAALRELEEAAARFAAGDGS